MSTIAPGSQLLENAQNNSAYLDRRPSRWTVREIAWLAIVLAAVCIFNLATIRSGQIWDDDVGQYLQHAKNIATGAPYGFTTFVTRPGIWTPGPRNYPPLFPSMLAAVYRWKGLDFHLMKIEIVITLVAGLAVIFGMFRSELDLKARLALVAIVGFNPIFWEYKDCVIPDISFVPLLFIALIAMANALSSEGGDTANWSDAFTAGVLAYLAYSVKATAIVLLPIPLAFSLLHRRRISKPAWIITCTSSALVLAQAWASGDIRSYLGLFRVTRSKVPLSIRTTIHFYIGSFCDFFDNGHGKPLRWVLFLIFCVLALAGLFRQLRQGLRVWEVFTIFYVALLLVWEQMESRYLFPLFPLFLLYAFSGMQWLMRTRAIRAQVLAFGLILAAVGANYAAYYAAIDLRSVGKGITDPQAQEIYTFVRTHASAEDVIEFPAPRVLAFFAQRRTSVYFPLSKDQSDGELWKYLDAVGATYVTASDLDQQFWLQFIEANRTCMTQVFANSEFRLYRLEPVSSRSAFGCKPSLAANIGSAGRAFMFSAHERPPRLPLAPN